MRVLTKEIKDRILELAMFEFIQVSNDPKRIKSLAEDKARMYEHAYQHETWDLPENE